MAEEKKPKKPKSKARKIVEWVLTGIFLALFGFFGVMQIVAQTSKAKNHGVPNYGGMQVLEVLTDSMEPEYKVKSVVFVKKVDMSSFKVDDDITFMWDIGQGTLMPMTHRLSDIKTPEETGTGHYQFTAHGINSHSSQCNGDCTYQTQVFNETVVLGKVVGHSVVVGAVFNFMTTPWGLLILLLIPAMYLIVTSVIDIVKAAKDPDEKPALEGGPNPEGNESALSNLSKEDIERLKQDMLNEMMEEKTKGGNGNEEKQ